MSTLCFWLDTADFVPKLYTLSSVLNGTTGRKCIINAIEITSDIIASDFVCQIHCLATWSCSLFYYSCICGPGQFGSLGIGSRWNREQRALCALNLIPWKNDFQWSKKSQVLQTLTIWDDRGGKTNFLDLVMFLEMVPARWIEVHLNNLWSLDALLCSTLENLFVKQHVVVPDAAARRHFKLFG